LGRWTPYIVQMTTSIKTQDT